MPGAHSGNTLYPKDWENHWEEWNLTLHCRLCPYFLSSCVDRDSISVLAYYGAQKHPNHSFWLAGPRSQLLSVSSACLSFKTHQGEAEPLCERLCLTVSIEALVWTDELPESPRGLCWKDPYKCYIVQPHTSTMLLMKQTFKAFQPVLCPPCSCCTSSSLPREGEAQCWMRINIMTGLNWAAYSGDKHSDFSSSITKSHCTQPLTCWTWSAELIFIS